jgi:hypothetical protein
MFSSTFSQYESSDKIGEGSYGEVYRGYLYGQEVAVKKLKFSEGLEDGLKDFKTEVKILR